MGTQSPFDYANPQEEYLRRSDVKLQEPGILETLGAGMEAALYQLPTYNAVDKYLQKDDPKYPKETLAKKFTEVPAEIFDHDMSASEAEHRIGSYKTQSYYNALKEYKDPYIPFAYDLLSSGVTSLIDPTTIAELLAFEASPIGFASKLSGLNTAGKVVASNFMAKTAVHFAENFAVGTLVNTAMRYPLNKYSSDFTGMDSSFGETVKSSAMNALFMAPIQAVTHSLMNYHAEQKILGNKDIKLWQAFARDGESVTKQFEDMGKGYNGKTFSQDAHEYAYNFKDGESYNKPSGTLYGLKKGFYENTIGADPQLTDGTVVLSNSHEALKGSAQYHGTGGDLYAIDAAGARLANENALVKMINENPDAFPYVKTKSIKTLHDLSDAELPFLIASLRKAGYDGIKSEIRSYNARVDHAEEPYTVQMFKETLKDLHKEDIGAYNYNRQLGYNPSETEFYNAPKQLPFEQPGIRTETYSKLKTEGYASNGKRISLEDNGYFITDPIQYDDSFIQGYVNYWSKEQIDEINLAVTKTKDFESIYKSYPDITEGTKSFLDDLKVYEEFDAAAFEEQKIMQKLSTDFGHRQMTPEEWKTFGEASGMSPKEMTLFKSELETLSQFLEQDTTAIGGKTSKQMTAIYDRMVKNNEELKPASLVRKKFEQLFKDASELPAGEKSLQLLVEKRALFDSFLEKMKKENPDHLATIIKAAKHCLTTR